MQKKENSLKWKFSTRFQLTWETVFVAEISIAAVKPMAFIVAVPLKRKAFKTHIRQHLSKIKYTESGIQQSLCFATFPGEIC